MLKYISFAELVAETRFEPEQEQDFHMHGLIPDELITRDKLGRMYDERLRRLFVVADRLALPGGFPIPERIQTAVREEKGRTDRSIKTKLECLSMIENENEISAWLRMELHEEMQYLGCLNLFRA